MTASVAAMFSLPAYSAGSWRAPSLDQKAEYGGAGCNRACETHRGASRKIYVIGDSHARALYTGFREQFPDVDFVFITADGCSFFAPELTRDDVQSELCRRGIALAQKTIAAQDGDVILLQFWTQAADAPHFTVNGAAVSFGSDADFVALAEKGTDEWKRLIGSRHLTVMGQIPGFDWALSPVDCTSRPFRVRDCSVSPLSSPNMRRVAAMNERLAAGEDYFVDPFRYLCDDASCRNFDGGKSLYSDNNHLSMWGSAYFAKRLRSGEVIR